MARKCTICNHKNRNQIDLMLVNSEKYRKIAEKFSVSITSLTRHKEKHLPELLQKTTEAKETDQADRIMEQVDLCLSRVNKLFNSCDKWLSDPDNPEEYTLEPRENELKVIYYEKTLDGKPIRKKASLSYLLDLIRESGVIHDSWEVRSMDPRKLILDTSSRLSELIDLLLKMKTTGELESRIKALEEQLETRGGGKKWG